ncbi:MAG: helix-turn-helix domain-containing protein [Ruminococcaceae bacterium]|nr:helix-turn-helix domain-containing protein [Oscillospiraceae bacterium]
MVILMDELKLIIARNITALRRRNNITQLELAEKLNYSDKAVSKWERGESLPDITVLKSIADIFDVTVDYLLKPEHREEEEKLRKAQFLDKVKRRNCKIIMWMSILLVWLLSTVAFVIVKTVSPKTIWSISPFLFAVPISFILGIIFNSVWFNRRHNFFIVSLLMWSFIAVLFFVLYWCNIKVFLLFALGIPGQAIIFLWSGMRFAGSKKQKHK